MIGAAIGTADVTEGPVIDKEAGAVIRDGAVDAAATKLGLNGMVGTPYAEAGTTE